MSGETNLAVLLREMQPILNPGAYVFCNIPDKNMIKDVIFIGLFKEPEGWTAILAREVADELNLKYSFIAAWITLTVHSALEAVGLTAAVAKALAEVNIPCNVVAGYYHDHLFVPSDKAQAAMEALSKLVV
ncbi:MAG: ACT domain-containing protein [Saprospiraceae bacterium]